MNTNQEVREVLTLERITVKTVEDLLREGRFVPNLSMITGTENTKILVYYEAMYNKETFGTFIQDNFLEGKPRKFAEGIIKILGKNPRDTNQEVFIPLYEQFSSDGKPHKWLN